jgi:hypothetical protein
MRKIRGRVPSTIVIITFSILLLHSRSSLAQSQTIRSPANADRGFLGAGLFVASDDASNRVRFPDVNASRSPRFTIEAAIVSAGRIGLGFEFSTLGTVTGSSNAACCILRDEQKETSVLAVVRGRAWRKNRLAVDVVGGMGVLFQHRETMVALRQVAGSAVTTVEDRKSPAFAIGADLPFFVAHHIALVPQIRFGFLRRGELDTPNVTRASSQTSAVGLTGRVLW